MSTNPLNDISAVYLQEVLEPQIGKKQSAPSGGKKVEKGQTGEEASAKRIRQAVYDIRYRARREGIELQQAYNQYMSHTTMTGLEKTAVKEKLGIGPGGGSVSEEFSSKKYQVRVVPKAGTGKTYTRYATREKISQLRSNPNISSVEMTKYGTPYEGEKTKGEYTAKALNPGAGEKYEKKYGKGGKNTVGDLDRDGTKEPNKHEYAGVKDNAIKAAMAKRKTQKESFSNWRQDLVEAGKIEDPNATQYQPKIKEKSVNNYAGGKDAVVQINPVMREAVESLGGELLEMVELGEDFIIESSEVAADYFCEHGLNEEGLDILIEDMGLENFVDFVFEIGQEYNLTEARTLVGKKKTPATGKQLGVSRKAAPGKTTKAAVEKYGTTRKISASPSSTVKKKTVAVKKAVEKQPEKTASKKPVRDAIARGIFGAVKAYQQGMERHRAATKTAGKAAKVAGKAAREIGKGVVSGVKTTAKVAKDVHGVLSKEEIELDEKLTSKTSVGSVISDFVHSKDPKFSGDTKKERIQRALGAYYKMHPSKSRKNMEEAAPVTTQQTQQPQQQKPDPKTKQLINIQKKRTLDTLAQLNKGFPVQAEEVENIEELTRYAKETGKSFRTKKPTSKGGKYGGSDVQSQAMRSVLKSMGAGRAGVASRGKKKVPGKKPPAAGEYGAPASPAQKVAKRRADAQRAQDMMHSRFD
jgi:hypothetical protein